MTLAIVHSRANVGIDAPAVTIEVHLSKGLPGFSIVGLPEAAVRESKDRVRSALINSQFEFPARKIIVNLAPADLPKEGGRFDLPIAIGILAASDQIPREALEHYEFAGELALSGALRSFQGCLPFALATRRHQRGLIIPIQNATEVGLVEGLSAYAAEDLLDVCFHLQETTFLPEIPHHLSQGMVASHLCLSDVSGQHRAKRALQIAAAGGHSLLMFGPPGTGKTMIASRLPGILPPLNDDEALQSAAIWSTCGKEINLELWRQRPFRHPHHTASNIALVGGGNPPRPGEISLAHHGVLFLDELPEFHRHVLESLREPLESGRITISRAAHQAEFPAEFQLIAAMNPCPCGHFGNPATTCRCSAEQIKRYQNRLSGPFLDRIDLQVEVPAIAMSQFVCAKPQQQASSAEIRLHVLQAREIQQQRQGSPNAKLTGKALEIACEVTDSDQRYLKNAIERMKLSARAYHRILKVARTIADLEAAPKVGETHLLESLTYRGMEQNT